MDSVPSAGSHSFFSEQCHTLDSLGVSVQYDRILLKSMVWALSISATGRSTASDPLLLSRLSVFSVLFMAWSHGIEQSQQYAKTVH